MDSFTGKGKPVSSLDKFASTSSLAPWLVSACALSLVLGLSTSKPKSADFSREVWTPALAGLKAEIRQQTQHNPTSSLIESVLSRIPLLLPALRASNNAELDKLPALWSERTTWADFGVFTYFKYEEPACFSDYLGIAGSIVSLRDRCQVEPYRLKGAAQQ